jgi:hypothetical protein
VLAADRVAGSARECVSYDDRGSGACGGRRADRPRAAPRWPTDRDQGRHAGRRAADHARLSHTRAAGGGGRGDRAAAARRGSDPDRDHERPRADDLPLDGERRERDHAQPLGPDAHARRIFRRIGRRGHGRDGAGGHRLRRWWLDPDPGRVLWSGGNEAIGWPGVDAARTRAVAGAERLRAAGALGARQRAAARRNPRRGAGRRRDSRRRRCGRSSRPRLLHPGGCGLRSRARSHRA